MAPTFAFPAPVLSVAADAVRELEGGEALTGLWTLFTKCKASLKDGHRLENISWRLWYREMATTPQFGPASESESEKEGHRLLDEKAALAREEEDTQADMLHVPSTHSPLPSFRIPVTSPRTHPQSTPVGAHAPTLIRRNSFVGKFIVDMLPNPLPPTEPRQPSMQTSTVGSHQSQPSTSYFTIQAETAAQMPDTHSLPIRCHLPTPAGSELHLIPSSTDEEVVHTQPEPIVQVHVDPAPPTTPPSALPQLVIVHPTPGPTPHPTPPATPIFGLSATPSNTQSLEKFNPAPVSSPKFTLRAEGSTTSSSSDSSSASGRTAVSSSSSDTTSTADLGTVADSKSDIVATPTLSQATAPPPPSQSASKTSAAPVVRKSHSSPVGTHLSPDAGPSRTRTGPRAQGHIRQTSSASSTGADKAKDERNKSKSRSRSRGAADGPRAGLMMTSATGKRGGTAAGSGQRGRAVTLRKTSSRTGAAGGAGRVITRDKRPTFNIGSHSDDVGSKSAGSGSSVSGPTNAVQQVQQAVPKQQHQGGLMPPPRQQSATRLMPPPSRPPLPDPSTVLPPKQQQSRRTIVVATSDSDDYETETDVTETDSEHGDGVPDAVLEEEGDTADWSSEDMSTDDVEVVVRRGGAAQPASGHDKKGHIPQQRRNHSTPAITDHQNHHNHTRTTTTTTTTTHNRQRQAPQPHAQHPHVALSRAQQSRRNQAASARYVVEQAALEAARIDEMFTKKPVPSSEDLQAQRTRSVGLLTQLMNPDPNIFPPSHPYRRGHSSGDVKNAGGRGFGGGFGGGGLTMTKANNNEGAAGGERRPVVQEQSQGLAKRPMPQRRASAGPAPGLRMSKSSAAIPVASQVQVGSVSREPSQDSDGIRSGIGAQHAGSGTSGGYRPKGRPADQEMEDTESEGENGDTNGILVSKSVAQEKLKALAARRGIMPLQDRKGREEEADPVPNWLRGPESADRKGRRTTSPEELQRANNSSSSSSSRNKQSQHDAPAPAPTPIPFGHPYNLPPPAAPSTPRTTRRLMLQTEMSESLRRNLLWERQVSKVNLVGFRRSASGGGSGRNDTVLGGGPLKPLTMLPSVVQVKVRQPGAQQGRSPPPRDKERERRGSGGAQETETEREERKNKAIVRNRSWANEFHVTGW